VSVVADLDWGVSLHGRLEVRSDWRVGVFGRSVERARA
jgi:hypothetical protein